MGDEKINYIITEIAPQCNISRPLIIDEFAFLLYNHI